MTREQAERLFATIVATTAGLEALVTQAANDPDSWGKLGYDSWDAYCRAVLDADPNTVLTVGPPDPAPPVTVLRKATVDGPDLTGSHHLDPRLRASS